MNMMISYQELVRTFPRYEAIAVGTALALRSNPQLLEPAQPISDWLFEAEFEGIVTADSANNTTQLKNRIFYVRDKLLGV